MELGFVYPRLSNGEQLGDTWPAYYLVIPNQVASVHLEIGFIIFMGEAQTY
jgi:hypothetical protein